MSVTAKKYVFAERFVGEPKLSDFKLVEEELPPLKENGKIYKRKRIGVWHNVSFICRGAG